MFRLTWFEINESIQTQAENARRLWSTINEIAFHIQGWDHHFAEEELALLTCELLIPRPRHMDLLTCASSGSPLVLYFCPTVRSGFNRNLSLEDIQNHYEESVSILLQLLDTNILPGSLIFKHEEFRQNQIKRVRELFSTVCETGYHQLIAYLKKRQSTVSLNAEKREHATGKRKRDTNEESQDLEPEPEPSSKKVNRSTLEQKEGCISATVSQGQTTIPEVSQAAFPTNIEPVSFTTKEDIGRLPVHGCTVTEFVFDCNHCQSKESVCYHTVVSTIVKFRPCVALGRGATKIAALAKVSLLLEGFPNSPICICFACAAEKENLDIPLGSLEGRWIERLSYLSPWANMKEIESADDSGDPMMLSEPNIIQFFFAKDRMNTFQTGDRIFRFTKEKKRNACPKCQTSFWIFKMVSCWYCEETVLVDSLQGCNECILSNLRKEETMDEALRKVPDESLKMLLVFWLLSSISGTVSARSIPGFLVSPIPCANCRTKEGTVAYTLQLIKWLQGFQITSSLFPCADGYCMQELLFLLATDVELANSKPTDGGVVTLFSCWSTLVQVLLAQHLKAVQAEEQNKVGDHAENNPKSQENDDPTLRALTAFKDNMKECKQNGKPFFFEDPMFTLGKSKQHFIWDEMSLCMDLCWEGIFKNSSSLGTLLSPNAHLSGALPDPNKSKFCPVNIYFGQVVGTAAKKKISLIGHFVCLVGGGHRISYLASSSSSETTRRHRIKAEMRIPNFKPNSSCLCCVVNPSLPNLPLCHSCFEANVHERFRRKISIVNSQFALTQ